MGGRTLRLLPVVAADLVGQVDRLTARITSAILRDVPEYRDSEATTPGELRPYVRANLVPVLEWLLHGEAPIDFGPHERTGRRRAEQGLSLEAVLHAYRLSGRMIWEASADVAKARFPESLDDLIDEAVAMWEVIDRASAVVATSYRAREAELTRRDEQRRSALMDTLLQERDDMSAVLAAASALGLPASASFLVIVGPHDGPADTGVSRLVATLKSRPARQDWLLQVVSRSQADHDVAVLATTHGDEQGWAADAPSEHGPLAAGPVVHDLSELPKAYRYALLALRTLGSAAPGIIEFDERLPEVLLASAPELAERLVERGLGRLSAVSRAEQHQLLGTVKAFLDAGCSVTEAAQRLACHRNTIYNRLHRFESLTGNTLATHRDIMLAGLAVAALESGLRSASFEGEPSGVSGADQGAHGR
jgi:hypothetical protein